MRSRNSAELRTDDSRGSLRGKTKNPLIRKNASTTRMERELRDDKNANFLSDTSGSPGLTGGQVGKEPTRVELLLNDFDAEASGVRSLQAVSALTETEPAETVVLYSEVRELLHSLRSPLAAALANQCVLQEELRDKALAEQVCIASDTLSALNRMARLMELFEVASTR